MSGRWSLLNLSTCITFWLRFYDTASLFLFITQNRNLKYCGRQKEKGKKQIYNTIRSIHELGMVVRSHGDLSRTSCLTLSFESLASKLTFHYGLLCPWKLALITWLWNGIDNVAMCWNCTEENATKKTRKKQRVSFSIWVLMLSVCPS